MRQSIFSKAHAETLLSDLQRANTEQAKKELLLQYLTKAFVKDEGAQRLIGALAKGAERTIANIPRGGQLGRGRADTQTETVIVEWEKDLAKTGLHAVDQLREYLIGNWKSGQEYRYVLIATDGIKWRIYAPDWSHLKNQSFRLTDDFILREIRRFDLTPETLGDFPFFLDEILFVSKRKIATLENIEADFGNTSATFINSMRALKQCEDALRRKSELKTAFDQWRRFLSIAYGRFDDSPGMFLVHTYLSAFAKMLAYAVIGKNLIEDDKTLTGVLSGSIFEEKFLIERFVEDDFFHWVTVPEYFKILKPMFREINRQISEYDFSEVKEDILKGVYQELIDLDTRHALGEYFTPDWLCERIVEELPIERSSRILDPACGSGSFLRAAIARLRNENKKTSAEELSEQICGIDIHPLSVQIAKTTVLLALSELIGKSKRPITLHIYLANSLLVPSETADLFKATFKISIDNKVCAFNVTGVIGQEQFDQLITLCDDLVNNYEKTLDRNRFIELTAKNLPDNHGSNLPAQLYDIYCALKQAKDAGRDSIWKFIIQNSYKPVFLKNRFDIVVGNPPWLTYADIANADYQSEIKRLADEYNVTPPNKANMPHLEIAAVFLAHSINYFLKPSGILAFVLPRSFISADQHDRTRSAETKGVKLKSVWDLIDISPLFRVPSCVFFAYLAAEGNVNASIPAAGISGLKFSGRLPRSQMHWTDATSRLKSEKVRWYFSQLQAGKKRSRSALTNAATSASIGQNAYADRFKQGATIVPRSFYFVESDKADLGAEDKDSVVILRPSLSMLRDAKIPWKNHTIAGKIEGRFLFHTAVAKNVLSFLLVDPPIVVLPVAIELDENDQEQLVLLGNEELLKRGYRFASRWFLQAEKLWNTHRTEKAEKSGMSYLDRLDFQHGITEQDLSTKYLVIYTASASDACAVVIDRREFSLPFVVESKTYWCSTSSLSEAHYLCSYLNSGYANEKIKDFQSRGLFGPRDIHKTIVKLPFPRFDGSNEDHKSLAKLGANCAAAAQKMLNGDKKRDFDSHALGRMRTKIREHLEDELNEIDVLVEKLSTGKSEAAIRATGKGRSRKGRGTLRLFD